MDQYHSEAGISVYGCQDWPWSVSREASERPTNQTLARSLFIKTHGHAGHRVQVLSGSGGKQEHSKYTQPFIHMHSVCNTRQRTETPHTHTHTVTLLTHMSSTNSSEVRGQPSVNLSWSKTQTDPRYTAENECKIHALYWQKYWVTPF